jgi:hypothetical protein
MPHLWLKADLGGGVLAHGSASVQHILRPSRVDVEDLPKQALRWSSPIASDEGGGLKES